MKKPGKKFYIILIFVAVSALIVIGSVMSKPDTAAVPSVNGAVLEISDLVQTITAVGTLTAESTRTVYAGVASSVEEVFVKPGDTVAKGDALILLDPDDSRRDYEQAQIDFNRTLNNAKDKLFQARVAYRNRILEEETAVSELSRTQVLFNNSSATERQLNEATQRLEIARMNLNAAREYLNLLTGQDPDAVPTLVSENDDVIINKMPDIRQAQLTFQRSEERLQKTRITASISGTVTAVNYKAGDLVGAGQPVAEIADLSGIKVELFVDEVDLGSIKTGQAAVIRTDSMPTYEFHGTVVQVPPVITQSGGNRGGLVTVELVQTDPMPYAGASCSISITSVLKADALTLPLTALREDSGEQYVFVAEGTAEETKIRKVSVETGVSTIKAVEVVSGLSQGDRVIADYSVNLKDGMFVKVKTEDD